ncbi:hypothetical protein LTR08_005408 [Meristemomyces frigidus]|nr:hypothetical protein LTR08_005408 [Meristemomyces frigidus]
MHPTSTNSGPRPAKQMFPIITKAIDYPPELQADFWSATQPHHGGLTTTELYQRHPELRERISETLQSLREGYAADRLFLDSSAPPAAFTRSTPASRSSSAESFGLQQWMNDDRVLTRMAAAVGNAAPVDGSGYPVYRHDGVPQLRPGPAATAVFHPGTTVSQRSATATVFTCPPLPTPDHGEAMRNPENQPDGYGTKKSKFDIDFVCATCPVQTRADIGNTGIHCTTCCNKAHWAGYCEWEEANLELVNGRAVSTALHNAVVACVERCRAAKLQFGWCGCSTQAVRGRFANAGRPTGSFFGTVGAAPASNAPAPRKIGAKTSQLPPHTLNASQSRTSTPLHNLPRFAHSTIGSQALVPGARTSQTPADDDVEVLSSGPAIFSGRSNQLPSSSSNERNELASAQDKAPYFSELHRKRIDTHHPVPRTLQASDTVESLSEEFGCLVNAEAVLFPLGGFDELCPNHSLPPWEETTPL